MTDERIKEEYDVWISDGECTESERRFFSQYHTENHPTAVGFYAGFRTAERLAKIEALEGVLSLANDGRVESLVIDIQDTIDELKATASDAGETGEEEGE